MSVGEKRGLLSESSMRDTVKRLDESLAELKRRSDLDGLLRLQAEAQALRPTPAAGPDARQRELRMRRRRRLRAFVVTGARPKRSALSA